MEIDGIVLVEQEHENYFPFSILHPQWELRTGMHQHWERIQQLFPAIPMFFIGRKDQTDLFLEKNESVLNNQPLKGNVLFLDARFIPSITFLQDIQLVLSKTSSTEVSFYQKNTSVSIGKFQFFEQDAELPNISTNFFHNSNETFPLVGSLIQYLWDAVEVNKEIILRDSLFLEPSTVDAQFLWQMGVFSYGTGHQIHLGKDVNLHSTVVLDSRNGPIILGNNVTVMPHTVLFGPIHIGDHSTVNANSSITGGCSIGPNCRVRGEVSVSIFQAFSNKAHDGFLGHSFISEYVNLGAGTTTSNLKNTYGEITIEFPNKQSIKTGKQFLGSFIGDHSKTAILTKLNTGTVIGTMCTIATSEFPPKYVESFSWIQGSIHESVILSKAFSVMEHVKSRRNELVSQLEISILQSYYESISTS